MKNSTLQLGKKNIDVNNFLTTIDNNKSINIEIGDYSELGFIINSLISVCQTASLAFNDNQDQNEYQKEKLLGSSSLDIANVLSFAKKLIPSSELQLLDIIRAENIEQ